MPTQIPIQIKFKLPDNLWHPRELILDVKALREWAYRYKFKGPFVLVMSNKWTLYLDIPFNASNFVANTNKLKRVGDVVRELPGIKEIYTSDQLNDWDVVMYEE